MKKVLCFFFTCFVLFFDQDAFGQANFLTGYIISNKNDTTFGLIDYRGDARNSKYCVFKLNKKADPVTYKPSELRAYRFIEGKYYVSRYLPVKGDSLLVFAEYLVDGIADLYCYQDDATDNYYIEKENGELFLLSNEEKKIYIEDHGNYIQQSNRYIGLLNLALGGCMELQPEINKAELNHRSLIKITRDYHNIICKDQECVVYERKLPAIRLQYSPFIGLSTSGLKFGWHKIYKLYESFEYKRIIHPVAGIIMNTSLPRFNEKLSLQTDLEFSKYDFVAFQKSGNDIETISDDVNIRFLYLRFSGSIKYTYPKGIIRPVFYTGIGMQYNIPLKTERIHEVEFNNSISRYIFQDVSLTNILVGVCTGAGIDCYFTEKHIIFLNVTYSYLLGNTSFAQAIVQIYGIRTGIYL